MNPLVTDCCLAGMIKPLTAKELERNSKNQEELDSLDDSEQAAKKRKKLQAKLLRATHTVDYMKMQLSLEKADGTKGEHRLGL